MDRAFDQMRTSGNSGISPIKSPGAVAAIPRRFRSPRWSLPNRKKFSAPPAREFPHFSPVEVTDRERPQKNPPKIPKFWGGGPPKKKKIFFFFFFFSIYFFFRCRKPPGRRVEILLGRDRGRIRPAPPAWNTVIQVENKPARRPSISDRSSPFRRRRLIEANDQLAQGKYQVAAFTTERFTVAGGFWPSAVPFLECAGTDVSPDRAFLQVGWRLYSWMRLDLHIEHEEGSTNRRSGGEL